MNKEQYINGCKTILSMIEDKESCSSDYGDHTYYVEEIKDLLASEWVDTFFSENPSVSAFVNEVQEGGYELGANCFIVFSVNHAIHGKIFLKHYGWFSSTEGYFYEDIHQVIPEKVMVTQYNEIKN